MAKNLVNTFFTGNLHKFYKKTGKKSMEEFIHGLQHLVWDQGCWCSFWEREFVLLFARDSFR